MILAYGLIAVVMIVSVLEGHSPIACLSSVIFRICGASRGPSPLAELLVDWPANTDGVRRTRGLDVGEGDISGQTDETLLGKKKSY